MVLRIGRLSNGKFNLRRAIPSVEVLVVDVTVGLALKVWWQVTNTAILLHSGTKISLR